jgi:hypothetical protein
LGRKFDRSARWGRSAIQVAKQADQPATVAAPEPTEVTTVVTEEPQEVPLAALAPTAPPETEEPTEEPGKSGRVSAWLAFTVGTLASVAGNVAHAAIQGGGVGSLVAAGFWPAALLISVEVLARVQWPAGKGYWLARWCGLTVIAAVAASVSYTHLSALLALWDGGWMATHVGPIAVDCLLTVGAAALLAIGKGRKS